MPLISRLRFRDTRQETRYTLLDLNPVAHQLWQFLRPSLSLRATSCIRAAPEPTATGAVLGAVPRHRPKDERGAEIIL
jgi:hypothetical protein